MSPDDAPAPAPEPAPEPAPAGACPICGKQAAATHRPFCSPRCRAVDLGRWLKGNYRVETEEPPADGEDERE